MTLKELNDFLRERGVKENMKIKYLQVSNMNEVEDLDVRIDNQDNSFEVD